MDLRFPMTLRERLSPNHGPRSGAVSMLVLHYTGMKSAADALDRLCDPAAQVSAHYLLDEDGTVWRLVPEERRAWHAGVSSWRECRDVNDASIGIEIANPGHEFGYRPFPEAQIAALETLCHDIFARHAIPPRNVVAHSDVAPLRKQDPGELFPWERLARARVGLWPEPPLPPAPAIAALPRLLAAIGYAVPDDLARVVTAFQRRYRPACCDGAADDETRSLVAAVAQLCGEV
jgi:N-acetylmuramoyl-L-alanine amidase